MKTLGLASNLKESATLAINQLALKKRQSGEEFAHLGFGQSPFPVPKVIQDELRSVVDRHEYLPTFGLMELREQFVKYYNRKFNTSFLASNTIIAPGSKEFIFQVLMLADARVIIPSPSWVSYGPQAEILNKDITYIQTSFKNHYLLTPEELISACEQDCSKDIILILNSPSNPTGQVYFKEELNALLPVLKKYKVTVISDEIYSDTHFALEPACSIASIYPEKTIVTTGLSKAFSAGGYRLGIGHIPEELSDLKNDLKVLISETFSCVSTPIQIAAKKAYSGDPSIEEYLTVCKRIHAFISDYMAKALHEYGFSVHKADGGFYLFPNLNHHKDKLAKHGIDNSSELATFLLDKYNIATLPGSDFYRDPEDLTLRLAIVDFDGDNAFNKVKSGMKLDEEFIKLYTPRLYFAVKSFKSFADDILTD